MSLVVVIPLALGGTLDVPKRVYLSYTQTSYTHTHRHGTKCSAIEFLDIVKPGKGFFFFYSCDIHPHCVKKKNWGSLLGKLLFQDFFLRGEREPWRET
jgi:hypothetical protein